MSLSTLSKTRKVYVENRTFNKNKWEVAIYLLFNGKPQCLLCSQVMSVMKEYSIRHHYKNNANHKDRYNSGTCEALSHLINDLKSKPKGQKITFFKETQIQTSSL
jgi:hypothetical protein